MHNPFAFVRDVVTGDDFIGRAKELEILRDNTLHYHSTFVVGLPRMGKSSLIAKCFFEDKFFTPRLWLDDAGLIPLYFVVSESSSPNGLLDTVSTALAMYLDAQGERMDCLDRVLFMPTLDAKFQSIKMALGHINSTSGKKFVFIFDEFDGVRRYPKGTDILNKLRSLSLFGPIVICSRRTPGNIEKELCGTEYFTKFAKSVFIGLFSDEDVKKYWDRFSVYFSSFNKDQFAAYKALVNRYVGNHPMLMSLMNNWLFQQGDDPFKFWHPDMPDSQREDAERSIRVEIKDALIEQMKYVEEQNLKDTAVKLVVGSSRKLNSDEIDLLQGYQFIRVVPNKVKKDIFGFDLGPTTADTKNRYICFSALASHLMKDIFDSNVEGYDLLRKTELDLRQLIEKYLDGICSNPFVEMPNGEEKWVQYQEDRIQYDHMNNTAKSKFDKAIIEMKNSRNNRRNNDCKATFDRKRINMLSSATLGNLWYIFIKDQWREYFASILDPENKSHGNSLTWYRAVFKYILDWRNAANHYNDAELSDSFLSKAQLAAQEVDRLVCAWLSV